MAPTMELLREPAVRSMAAKEAGRPVNRDEVRTLAHRVGVEAVARALDVFGVLDQ